MLDRLGRAGRRAVAVDLPGFGEADRPRPRRLGHGPARRLRRTRSSPTSADGGPPVLAGNSLGRSRRAAAGAPRERPSCPASCRSPPPAWTCRAGSRSSSATRSCDGCSRCRRPVPEAVVRNLVGRAYRVLAFARARRRPATRWCRPSPATTAIGGGRPLPGHGAADAARAEPRLRARRDPLPGAARVGRPRPHGLPPRRGASSRRPCPRPASRSSRASATARRSRPPSEWSSCCSSSRPGSVTASRLRDPLRGASA